MPFPTLFDIDNQITAIIYALRKSLYPTGYHLLGSGQCISELPDGISVQICLYFHQPNDIDITPRLLLTTFLTALLLSVGAPGVAGAAFICLTTIVVSLGLPAEAATFVLGIDSLLSLLRISNNVIGDTAVACAVAASEKQLDHAIYQKN